MNYVLILECVAGFLAAAGTVWAVKLLFAEVRAERDWVQAMDRLPDDQLRLIADILAEEKMFDSTNTALKRKYMAAAFRDLVGEMRTHEQISERSARVIQSALSQPSEAGQQAYAGKLAREMVQKKRAMAGAR